MNKSYGSSQHMAFIFYLKENDAIFVTLGDKIFKNLKISLNTVNKPKKTKEYLGNKKYDRMQ